MTELTLLILRIGFLLVMWLFIFAVVYALRSDLFGAPVRKLKGGEANRSAQVIASAPSPTPAPAAPQVSGNSPGQAASTLVITGGSAAGTSLPLDQDTITIGRSGDSTLAIVDEYTSTYHAKLARSGDRWMLTDLDSTNGTKVGGSRIKGTVALPTFTAVTIGTTTFELRP